MAGLLVSAMTVPAMTIGGVERCGLEQQQQRQVGHDENNGVPVLKERTAFPVQLSFDNRRHTRVTLRYVTLRYVTIHDPS